MQIANNSIERSHKEPPGVSDFEKIPLKYSLIDVNKFCLGTKLGQLRQKKVSQFEPYPTKTESRKLGTLGSTPTTFRYIVENNCSKIFYLWQKRAFFWGGGGRCCTAKATPLNPSSKESNIGMPLLKTSDFFNYKKLF